MVQNESSGYRLAGLCGGLFAVLLFLAVASVNIPHGASDAEITAWFSSTANQRADILSAVFLLFAGLSFLVFTAGLTRRLQAAAGPVLELARNSGLAFVALLFVAGSGVAIGRGALVDGEALPGADVMRAFTQLRYTAMGMFAMPLVAVTIACITYSVLRSGGLPRWFGWLGVPVAIVIAIASGFLVGQLAIPVVLLWAIAGGICLARTSSPLASPTPSTTAAHPVHLS
jgi:hypothetical protein